MHIVDDFYEYMKPIKLETYGIIDADNYIHTLGTDSKIIGRLFEMYTQPVLEKIANKNQYLLSTPESQTLYPDFVLMKDRDSKEKIAIDIKTTYVDSDQSTIKFTLGSYGSYMRNNTKNIEYKYTDYIKHYVIGFIYKRNGTAQQSQVFHYDDRESIVSPFYDVQYFIQEKYKIAGDKPGSGNTENIGSFSTKSFLSLKNGEGPFNSLGVDVFDLYWKYYPKYRSENKPYTSIEEFVPWFMAQEKEALKLLHPYDYESVKASIQKYALIHGIKTI